jgi:hypothetical protein
MRCAFESRRVGAFTWTSVNPRICLTLPDQRPRPCPWPDARPGTAHIDQIRLPTSATRTRLPASGSRLHIALDGTWSAVIRAVRRLTPLSLLTGRGWVLVLGRSRAWWGRRRRSAVDASRVDPPTRPRPPGPSSGVARRPVSAFSAITRSTSAISEPRKRDVDTSVAFLERQLLLGEPVPALDAEQVARRRAALQPGAARVSKRRQSRPLRGRERNAGQSCQRLG